MLKSYTYILLIGLLFPLCGLLADEYDATMPTVPQNGIKTFFSGINSHDILIDRSGQIWVANADVNTVTKLSPSGQSQTVIHNLPTTIGYYDTRSLMVEDQKGNIDVLTDNGNIVQLDSSGKPVGYSSVPNVDRVIDFTMDSTGALWAAGYWAYESTYTYTVPKYETYYDDDKKKWKTRYCGEETRYGTKTNYGENITLLNSEATVRGQLHMDSHNDFPAQMAADASGNIWVTQHNRNIVIKLDPVGTTIGQYDVGSHTEGIAIDPSGNVWVATDRHEIVKLSPAGQILARTQIDTKDWKYGADRLIADQSGYIWVANPHNAVIELNPSGNIVAIYAMPNPVALAIDANRNVWVVNDLPGGNNLYEISNAAVSIQYSPVTQIIASRN